MRFSLIMPTLGRCKEVSIFLQKLTDQEYKNFELIIVDQNEDERVYDIYQSFKNCISIKYIRSNKKGLSLNRNIGLNNCTGDIIAFPDDDCEYDRRTLENVLSFFNNNPKYAFYTCNTKDKNGQNAILKSDTKSRDITIFNIMRTGISFTIFIRADAIRQFRFDEQLGVGSEYGYGSGEESDLLLYLLKNKQKGRYHSGNFIYHPGKLDTQERVYSYSRGFGALYKKAVRVYRFYPLLLVFLYRILRTLIKLIFFKDKSISVALLKGRFEGFTGYKISSKGCSGD